MSESAISTRTANGVELKDLDGWGGDIGGEIIDQENYLFLLKPIVNGLPQGQKWTTLNLAKADELEKAAKRFEKDGHKNNTVLTLQAASTRHKGFTESHADRLWDEGNSDFGQMVDKGRSEEIILALGICSYYEHLAWFTGAVDGLENPNGVLVSLQAITADNKLIFARRKSVSVGQNKIGIIGGTLDYPVSESAPQPEHVAYGELVEELGIKKENASVRLITLIEDRYKRPVLLFRARVALRANQINEKWLKNLATNNEHSELFFPDNTLDGLTQFAKEHSVGEFHAPADLIFQQALSQKIREQQEAESHLEDAVQAGSTPF